MDFLQVLLQFFVLLDEFLEPLRVFLAELLGSLVGLQGQLSFAQQGQGFAEVVVTLGGQKLGFQGFTHATERRIYVPSSCSRQQKVQVCIIQRGNCSLLMDNQF